MPLLFLRLKDTQPKDETEVTCCFLISALTGGTSRGILWLLWRSLVNLRSCRMYSASNCASTFWSWCFISSRKSTIYKAGYIVTVCPLGAHLRQTSASMLLQLYHSCTNDSVLNGLLPRLDVPPLFSVRTESLASSQSCCSIDTDT